MEVLVERQQDLKLSWHPGCGFHKKGLGKSTYYVGPIGRRGPNTTEEDLKKEIKITEVPNSLVFYINFTNESKDLYETILNELENLIKYGDDIEIKEKRGPYNRIERIKPKPEYEDKIKEITERNEKINKEYIELVDKLEQLGCCCDDISGPKYEKLIDEYYELKEYVDYNSAYIHVCCHKDTKLYNYLNQAGILEKYFPQWYRDGKF